jgi:DNA-binding NarL/FixJ family response regulator
LGEIRILIADDHPLIREGLRHVLEGNSNMKVVGDAGDGQGAINLARSLVPDVVLLDLKMPGTDGIQASRVISHEFPDTKIIILVLADEVELLHGTHTGACGYLQKDMEPEGLIQTINEVVSGQNGGLFADRLLPNDEQLAMPRHEGMDALTSREKEVLTLIAQGESNRKIASKLFISEKTVKNHVTSIFRKIKVGDRTQAAIFAIKKHLVNL